MRSPKTHARSGFTLIELLLNITIISLLAAILFPAFGRVREMARRSTCQSNLKQLAMGMMQYTQDNDERFPASFFGPKYGSTVGQQDWGLWMIHIYPYVKNPQVFACPSTKRGDTFQYTGTPYGNLTLPVMFNYGYNQNFFNDQTGSTRSLVEIQQPSRLVMLADSTGTVFNMPRRIYNASNPSGGGGGWWSVPNEIDTNAIRHLNGSNLLFVDGHVKYMSQGQMGPDPSRAGQAAEQDRAYLPVRIEDDRLQ